MSINETTDPVIHLVASAFKQHFFFNRGMGGIATEAEVELAQVAIQIHEAVVPKDITARDQDRAYEYRSFLEQCGFSELFAHEFISDDDPDGIY
jgi:hypothetical protein